MANTWGIVGFGEAGSTFAAHLARLEGAHVVITDPVLTRMPGNERFARLNGVQAAVVDDIRALVSCADLCLSLVTPKSAMDAARAAASAWRDGLYIDFNSVSPAEKMKMAALFPRNAFVGAAILGSIAGEGSATRLALDGPAAGQAEALLNAAGFFSKAIGNHLGSAAALKMCRSIFMKGIECLLVETMLAAEEYQITTAVLESIRDTVQKYGFEPMVEMLITTHAVHCGRRSDEMEGVAAMLTEMHLPNIMSSASRAVLASSAKMGLTAHFRGALPSDSHSVIAILKQSYAENS